MNKTPKQRQYNLVMMNIRMMEKHQKALEAERNGKEKQNQG